MIVRMLKPVDPAQFLSGVRIDACIDPVPACPQSTRARVHSFMRPTRPTASLQTGSGLVPAPEIPPEIRADKPFTRGPTRPAEWSFWNPFGSDRRGPKHTRAEPTKS